MHPALEREALPRVVELAKRLVEREQDDHEDRQEQVQQHQARHDPHNQVAPLRAALDDCGLGAGEVGHGLSRHTRSSVPSARVYSSTPTRMIAISTIDSAAAAG